MQGGLREKGCRVRGGFFFPALTALAFFALAISTDDINFFPFSFRLYLGNFNILDLVFINGDGFIFRLVQLFDFIPS